MPSVANIDARMRVWSSEWFRSDFAIPPVDNYYDELWKNAEAYCATDRFSTGVRPNFEHVLGDMVAFAHWMEPAPWGNALRRYVSGDQPPQSLRFRYGDDAPYGTYTTVNTQLSYLLAQVARLVRKRSLDLDSGSPVFARYRRLICELRHAFDLGIYNLNYDNVAVTAWPEAFTGFDCASRFDPRLVHDRREWNFIYHLHGSVHHTIHGSFADAIRWQADLRASFRDGDEGQATNISSDRRTFLRSTLIAGGFKLDQLLIEPFHSLYASFTRHPYDSDAILIGGYGFGDAHVNRALNNCIERRHVQMPPDSIPVMILRKSSDGGLDLEYRRDFTSREMRRTLSAHCFQRGLSETPEASATGSAVSGRSFEISEIHKVAVWNGGFSEAANDTDRIIGYLNSGDPNLLRR